MGHFYSPLYHLSIIFLEFIFLQLKVSIFLYRGVLRFGAQSGPDHSIVDNTRDTRIYGAHSPHRKKYLPVRKNRQVFGNSNYGETFLLQENMGRESVSSSKDAFYEWESFRCPPKAGEPKAGVVCEDIRKLVQEMEGSQRSKYIIC